MVAAANMALNDPKACWNHTAVIGEIIADKLEAVFIKPVVEPP